MSWGNVGTFLLALVTGLGSITGIYVAFKDDTKLEADLSYRYESAPRQFSERLGSTAEKLKYANLYDSIKRIGDGALSHEQIDKMVNLSQAPYLALLDAPFEKGPDNYPISLLITLRNSGRKVIKDVHIKLPAKGLVQIRDDSRSDTVMPDPVSSVVIPSIVQNGVYTLWIHFQGDLKTLKEQDVYIGYSDGVAQVRVYEDFIGFEASMARYGILVLGALVMLAYCFLVAVYLLITTDRNNDANTVQR